MGKQSRRKHTGGTVATLEPGAPVPVVGGREPCPCGSGRRYKACHGLAGRGGAVQLVQRPFEGVDGECDLVAMRALVPAATAVLRTSAAHGDVEFTVASVLPMAWAALRRADGSVIVGLQTTSASGDASRDLAAALLRALAAAPGTPVPGHLEPGVVDGAPAPRLQDLLAPDQRVTPQVHDGFDYWIGTDTERTPEVQESLEQANRAVTPTRRLTGVDAAYWAEIDGRLHLRWVLPHAEDTFLDGLARLHADGGSTLGEGSRYIGCFRANGLVVPVWDLPAGCTPEQVEPEAAAFAARLDAAMAVTGPLTPAARGARAGLASRQLTLR